MGVAFTIVWGVALLAIAALLVMLVLTLKRGPVSAPPGADELETFMPLRDTLLFHYEESGTRSTVHDRVIVRLPGIAWETAWREDLLRLEVSSVEPRTVPLPVGWQNAQVLGAYDLRAFRMTEMGRDVEVRRFLSPIDVVLTFEGPYPEVRAFTRTDDDWTLATTVDLALDEFNGRNRLSGRDWVAVPITQLGQVCLLCPLADRS
jgi:hypothetical protein